MSALQRPHCFLGVIPSDKARPSDDFYASFLNAGIVDGLPPHALNCLIAVGKVSEEGTCEVGVQIVLGGGGFDRQDAKDLTRYGLGRYSNTGIQPQMTEV